MLLFAVPVYGDNTATYNGHKYQLFDESMTWSEAKAKCESLGGHLVTVTGAKETEIINELIKQGKKNYYWIGLKRDSSGNFSKWITGESASYTNWSGNDPNNYFGDESVVAIGREVYNPGDIALGWHDLPDDPGTKSDFDGVFNLSNAGFICEWDTITPETEKTKETEKRTETTTTNPAAKGTPYETYAGEGIPPLSRTVTEVKSTIITSPSEEIEGASYPLLQARATNVRKKKFRLAWNKLPGATKYVIYGNRCGRKNKYEFILETDKNFYVAKNLKKNKFYKYVVVAVMDEKVISVSKTVHVGLKNKKNPTNLIVNKNSVTLKTSGIGNTFQITGKIEGTNLKQHRKIRYETDNVNVATVNATGEIQAVGAGNCNVYAYAQNGVMAKIEVKVIN